MIRSKRKWHEVHPGKAFWTFAVFASLVFLMGGGSRYDISSLGPLRAISGLILAAAIWWQTESSFKSVSTQVWLLIALGIWMIIQVTPLPVAWWTALPGREQIALLGALLDEEQLSRPITLSPQRTLNSLAALIIPLVSVLLLALLDEKGWRNLVKLIVLAGVFSAVLGIAQLTIRGAPGLYFYEITNINRAVGIFSNRNHQALFLNVTLLFTLLNPLIKRSEAWSESNLVWIAARFLLVVGILINGSRTGMALLIIVGVIFAALTLKRARHSSSRSTGQLIAGGALTAGSVGLILVFAFLERIPAIQRFLEQPIAEDQRSESFPIVLDLAMGNLPFGVGFGAFEQAYRAAEPVDLLSPTYFNHAHNDWLQIIVEGGVPGALILLVALALIVWRIIQCVRFRQDRSKTSTLNWLGMFSILLIALHSFVDYPLRTPVIMMVAMVSIGMLFRTFEHRDGEKLQKRKKSSRVGEVSG